ncbi:hypothetical protein ACFP63_00960 [Oerskovia jenensis]|uniref:Uncharacterized protein n=1 Tax=Oerskovia jenensis TaxID=162169 RepID=A0ABS2LF81_9CELL|nr:hypothetical protein [Oerskovia jenensis]MBM7479078.1 hypothetical protein [Oerskovia jenensis]
MVSPLSLGAPLVPPAAPLAPAVLGAPVAAPAVPAAPSAPQEPAVPRRARRVTHRPLAPLLDGFAPLVPGERRLLTPAAPVVMANRVQSGVGALRLEVLAPTGRLVVGCVLDGTQSVILGPGPVHGPGTARPFVSVSGLVATLDLAQIRSLTRFVVLLRDPPPGGALLVVSAGTSRLEVALEPGAQGGSWVALTGHVVRGALVLRAEHEVLDGGLREATAAHGYDQLVWHGTDSLLNSTTQPEGRTPWQ